MKPYGKRGVRYKKHRSRMYYGLFKFMRSLSQKVESYKEEFGC